MRRASRSLSFAVSLIGGIAFSVLGLSAEEKSAAAPPNLAGRWTLDPDKSDDLRQKMREARGGGEGGPGSEEGGQRRGVPGGGMGGRGGGGGGGGGRGGGMGGGAWAEAGPQAVRVGRKAANRSASSCKLFRSFSSPQPPTRS